MAKKPESQFITSVHKHLLPVRQFYRMKNNNPFIGGVADVWYSGSKRDLWVEYKYLPIKVPRADVVPECSPQQLDWILGRRKEGRSVWVVVGTKVGGVIYNNDTEIEEGIAATEFMKRLLIREELALEIHMHCNL